MEYLIWKWLHVLSSTFLFGTGIGTAFHLFLATRSRRAEPIAVMARQVVVADWLFTATTIVFQPASGIYLMSLAGYSLTSRWILWSFVLYAIATACWLPVVWLQLRMRDCAAAALAGRTELPPEYWRYYRAWVALGISALLSFLAVFYLMVAKPV